MNKMHINSEGVIFIDGKEWGWHEEGLLYKLDESGFGVPVGKFDTRAELHEMIKTELEKNA